MLIVALATAVAVPAGIGVALYLVEYGKESRFASTVRYFIDVLTGVPSIVFGLFIYIVLVLGGDAGDLAAGGELLQRADGDDHGCHHGSDDLLLDEWRAAVI